MSRSKGKKNKHSQKRKSVDNMVGAPLGIKHVSKQPKYIRNVKFDEDLLLKVLKHPDNNKYQHEFAKFIYEPQIWGQYNKEYKIKFQPSKIKGMRLLIQITSIHAILNGKYYIYTHHHDDDHNDNNEQQEEIKESSISKSNIHYKTVSISKQSIIQSVSKTIMYTQHQLFTNDFFDEFKQNMDNQNSPKIMVINDDILDVSKYIMRSYHIKPLVLVMSSRSYGGGGYKKGAGGQEEDMCRRSTLFCNLEDPYCFRKGNENWSYPLPEYGGIYSPNVLVFRDGINSNYSFYIDHPLKMSFVSVYSYSSPNLDSNNLLSKTMVKRTLKKIETILRIAMLQKHKCIILSAFGCGAYENPPKHIAQLFKRVLLKNEYRNFFTMVIFAIIDDKNTGKAHNPQGNVIPFSKVFSVPILTLQDSP